MSAAPNLVGLVIESERISPSAARATPQCWPPDNDFPIVKNADGIVVTRYGDSRWDFAAWAGEPLKISFTSKQNPVSLENQELYKLIAAWWLYGPRAVRSVRTLSGRLGNLKKIFSLCSEHRILVSDLWRHIPIIKKLSRRITPAAYSPLIILLHELFLDKEELGFCILDEAGLGELSKLAIEYKHRQTPYIPPRIWAYQVNRVKECLEEFKKHEEKVCDFWDFANAAYERNLSATIKAKGKAIRSPFYPSIDAGAKKDGRIYYGNYVDNLERFGIADLVKKWVGTELNEKMGIRAFGVYLTIVQHAGLAYIMNFSLMRFREGKSLRVGCFGTEENKLGEKACFLTGETTKTSPDSTAKWIVHESVGLAVDAMETIALRRISLFQKRCRNKVNSKFIANPPLCVMSSEYWVELPKRPEDYLVSACNYNSISKMGNLFNQNELRITEEEYLLAKQMTPSLNEKKFKVGEVWPLAFHQLRRTGAVNMLSTGMVSEPSLQYQLKHLSRDMTRYYGNNHQYLNATVCPEAKGAFIKEMYLSVSRQFSQLAQSRYMSPHGEKRKSQILIPIEMKEHEELAEAAKLGQVSYTETFLGGCANPGPPCSLGGISNISGCMGNADANPCEWALIDKEKRSVISDLRNLLLDRQREQKKSSIGYMAVAAQLESAEKALELIDGS